VTTHSVRRIRRERGPSIAWSPRHDAYYVLAGLLPGASQIPALALTQATLLEVEALRRGDTSPVIFGLLAGHLCVDPGDKADYLMVDEVVRSRTSLSADDPTTELATEIRSLAADVLRRDKLPIGWYLEGMAGDVAPDPELRDLHAELFPEPWQFLLLRDDGSQGARGALIRIERRSQRSYAIPFLELLPASKVRGQMNARTALHWTNYITSQQVSPVAASEAIATSAETAGPSTKLGARFASWLKTPFHRAPREGDNRAPSSRDGSAVPPAAIRSTPSATHHQTASEATAERIRTPIPDGTFAYAKPQASIADPEPRKLESPTVASARVEAPKAEPPTVEPPKAAPPMAEAPSVEAAKVEAEKVEHPNVEQPKVEQPTVERPKVEAAKHDKDEAMRVQPPAGARDVLRRVERVAPSIPPEAPIATPAAERPAAPRLPHAPGPEAAQPARHHESERSSPRTPAVTVTRRRNLLAGAGVLTLLLSVGWYLTKPAASLSARAGASSAAVDTRPDADRARIMQLESDARALVHTDGCSSLDACRTAPLGWRECGGPRQHLVYCAASTDTVALFRKLDELRQAEMDYNEKTGRTGSCSFNMPPEVALQKGGQCSASR